MTTRGNTNTTFLEFDENWEDCESIVNTKPEEMLGSENNLKINKNDKLSKSPLLEVAAYKKRSIALLQIQNLFFRSQPPPLRKLDNIPPEAFQKPLNPRYNVSKVTKSDAKVDPIPSSATCRVQKVRDPSTHGKPISNLNASPSGASKFQSSTPYEKQRNTLPPRPNISSRKEPQGEMGRDSLYKTPRENSSSIFDKIDRSAEENFLQYIYQKKDLSPNVSDFDLMKRSETVEELGNKKNEYNEEKENEKLKDYSCKDDDIDDDIIDDPTFSELFNESKTTQSSDYFSVAITLGLGFIFTAAFLRRK